MYRRMLNIAGQQSFFLQHSLKERFFCQVWESVALKTLGENHGNILFRFFRDSFRGISGAPRGHLGARISGTKLVLDFSSFLTAGLL